MKILLISDEESDYLWEYYQPGRLDGIDIIISCGDLDPAYLRFLVTMSRARLLYVHGNHDGKYERNPPEGCECIEDRVVNIGGLRIMGLGGSLRYSPGPHQYTESQMMTRIMKMRWQLMLNKGVDIVVSHAPVRGIGDEENVTHRGFEAFRYVLNRYKPRYWAFGHVHLRYGNQKDRVYHSGETLLINACGRFLLDFEP